MNSLLIAHSRSYVHWCEGEMMQVVLCSRVRLVRSIAGERFPHWSSPEQQSARLAQLHGALRDVDPEFNFWKSGQLSPKEWLYFRERRIAGKSFAPNGSQVGIATMHRTPIDCRFNDGEHIKISAMRPGLQLAEAHAFANGLDDALSLRLSFAFDEKKGYLTADPASLGTGLRASLLFFLPALVAAEKMCQFVHAVQSVGCAIGGFYGTGSDPEGCIFQIHNRSSLGESEETIIRRLSGIGEVLQGHELAAREELKRTLGERLMDRMARVMAILSSARLLPLQEAIALLCQARLAAHLGFLDSSLVPTIDRLLTEIQPVHLQLRRGAWMTQQQQEEERAGLLRQTFAGIAPLRGGK
ncbi:MAG: hypothetical protein LBS68_00675 [Puniceicoccales bacterium]|jgi:protein arginine kinase|nr:hypothetical protein [Puniceicoccales bacterium]